MTPRADERAALAAQPFVALALWGVLAAMPTSLVGAALVAVGHGLAIAAWLIRPVSKGMLSAALAVGLPGGACFAGALLVGLTLAGPAVVTVDGGGWLVGLFGLGAALAAGALLDGRVEAPPRPAEGPVIAAVTLAPLALAGVVGVWPMIVGEPVIAGAQVWSHRLFLARCAALHAGTRERAVRVAEFDAQCEVPERAVREQRARRSP